MHAILLIWHWVQEVLGINIGVPGHTPRWYNFTSGSGSDIAELALLGTAYHWLSATRCHEGGVGLRGCRKHGTYDFTDLETGLTHKLCKKHHPHAPQKLTHLHIMKIHKRNKRLTYER